MRSDDPRKAALKTFADDLETDERLCALDRSFVTYYKTALDSNTNKEDDQRFLRVLKSFYAKIVY